MPKILLRYFILFIFFNCLIVTVQAQTENCLSCHTSSELKELLPLLKPGSIEERGLGIMDKGQVSNYLGNYGVLSNFHEYFNEAIRWPATASEVVHYSFGLGLIVASKGNVITSVIGAGTDKYDWVPKDGSRGQIFSGDVTVPPPDETPFLAMSDNPETWPEGYFDEQDSWVSTPGERHWPGKFRTNIDPTSPNFGEEVEGEFASDRDIYSVFDDSDNSHPAGPLGIEVEQMAYTYGRPYAEDMLIWEFTIHNKSGRQLDTVYVGYYAIFRPDFDEKDYINIIDSNPNDNHTNGDFVYIWDINNTKDGAWENDPTDLGIVGLNILETPQDMGVTDFHYFSRGVAPKIDEEMWAIISSNPDDPNLSDSLKQYYFHGKDRRIDNTHPDSLSLYFPDGSSINYFIMTGPFNLAPDSTVTSSVALVMGSSGNIPFEPDTTDLMNNMRITQQMYESEFQGSGPPKTPIVKGYGSDKQARIIWDSDAENSKDQLTGIDNFEGYKIYRSDDQGRTWGDPITNEYGIVIGYKPIKIFDLVDGIKGRDPAFNQSLGDDTGLQHSYTDDRLINGIEYWYCVTSYSKGNQNPDSLEQSYQSALGHSTMESHTVSITPGVDPQNYDEPYYDPVLNPDGSFPPIGGICQGIVKLDIVQPDSIKGYDYLVTFVDSTIEVVGSDTNYVLGFNLYRIYTDTGDTTLLLDHHLFSNETEDNLPVTDGFRLTVLNTPSGAASIGWTKVNGDTSTFYWNTKPVERYVGNPQVIQEDVYTLDDYQVTIDTTETGGLTARWYDFFTGPNYDTTFHLPLKVEIISDPENPIDISENTWLMEYAVFLPWESRKNYYSQLGWDLVPGGLAYTAGSAGWYERHLDILNFEELIIDSETGDTTYNGLLMQTNHQPDTYVDAYGDTVTHTAVAPSHGDEFTIRTYKPFRQEIRYEFTTMKTRYNADDIDLNKIRVVPDPYIVSNEWETSQFGKRLMFNHLPSECRITIFTVSGDLIVELDHADNKGYEFWDMKTYNDQFIAYGLYVYVVSVPNGQKKIGKFLVIK